MLRRRVPQNTPLLPSLKEQQKAVFDQLLGKAMEMKWPNHYIKDGRNTRQDEPWKRRNASENMQFTMPGVFNKHVPNELFDHAQSPEDEVKLRKITKDGMTIIAKGLTYNRHVVAVVAEFTVGLFAHAKIHFAQSRGSNEKKLLKHIDEVLLTKSFFGHIASLLFDEDGPTAGSDVNPAVRAAVHVWQELNPSQQQDAATTAQVDSAVLLSSDDYKYFADLTDRLDMFAPIRDQMETDTEKHFVKDIPKKLTNSFVTKFFAIKFLSGKNNKKQRQRARETRDKIIDQFMVNLDANVDENDPLAKKDARHESAETKAQAYKKAAATHSEEQVLGPLTALLRRVYDESGGSKLVCPGQDSAHHFGDDCRNVAANTIKRCATTLAQVLGLRHAPDEKNLKDETLRMHFAMAFYRMRTVGNYMGQQDDESDDEDEEEDQDQDKKMKAGRHFNIIPQTSGNKINFFYVNDNNINMFLKDVGWYVDIQRRAPENANLADALLKLRDKLVKHAGGEQGKHGVNRYGNKVELKDVDMCWKTFLAGLPKAINDKLPHRPAADLQTRRERVADDNKFALMPDSYARNNVPIYFQRNVKTNGYEIHPLLGTQRHKKGERGTYKKYKKQGAAKAKRVKKRGKVETNPTAVAGKKKSSPNNNNKSKQARQEKKKQAAKKKKEDLTTQQKRREAARKQAQNAFKAAEDAGSDRAQATLTKNASKMKKIIAIDPDPAGGHAKVAFRDEGSRKFMRPIPTAASMMATWKQQYGDDFSWNPPRWHSPLVQGGRCLCGRHLWREMMNDGLDQHGGEAIFSSKAMLRAVGSHERRNLNKYYVSNSAYRTAINTSREIKPHTNLHELVSNAQKRRPIVPVLLDAYVNSGRMKRRFTRYINKQSYIDKWVQRLMLPEKGSGQKAPLKKEEVVVVFGKGWETGAGAMARNKKGWSQRACHRRIKQAMERKLTLFHVDEYHTSKKHAFCQGAEQHGEMKNIHLKTLTGKGRKELRKAQREYGEKRALQKFNTPTAPATASAPPRTKSRQAAATRRQTPLAPASDAASPAEKTTWKNKAAALSKKQSIHRLVKCPGCIEKAAASSSSSEHSTGFVPPCANVHNRDSNAASNMLAIFTVMHAKKNVNMRPFWLCGQEEKSSSQDENLSSSSSSSDDDDSSESESDTESESDDDDDELVPTAATVAKKSNRTSNKKKAGKR